MNAAHTPTPWTEQEMPGGCNDRITVDDGEGTTICEFPYGLDANAAFIVRACNSHDALVAGALKTREAITALFDQCLSNGMKDAWGKPIDHTLLNEANSLITAALAAAGETP